MRRAPTPLPQDQKRARKRWRDLGARTVRDRSPSQLIKLRSLGAMEARCSFPPQEAYRSVERSGSANGVHGWEKRGRDPMTGGSVAGAGWWCVSTWGAMSDPTTSHRAQMGRLGCQGCLGSAGAALELELGWDGNAGVFRIEVRMLCSIA